MAGIYIHIPFCKQRCTYCDFYTRVAPGFVESYIQALKNELSSRKNYFNDVVKTIYFGGGTPSILNKEQLAEIFEIIFSEFSVSEDAEITLEANPDDLSVIFLNELKQLPVNRLSIGIQSFEDKDLKFMNRRHSALQAMEAVYNAQQVGFDNISIDLIYGLPGQSLNQWKKQLETAFTLKIQHISAYGLTYEKGTKLYAQRQSGMLKVSPDIKMNKMFALMLDEMKREGFEAYEISNFAKAGFRSKHNSSYWKQEPYLGVGPSAHSFDGNSRRWNVSSIKKYIQALQINHEFSETEILTDNEKFNDYVMVALRTCEGADIQYIKKYFGDVYTDYFMKNIDSLIQTKHVSEQGNNYALTAKGLNIADFIISKLMKV